MVERTSIDYGEAILEVANRRGMSGGLRLLTIAGAAEAAGVSRATIYRNWATIVDLNIDLGIDVACHPSGWQRRILALDPAQPFDDLIVAAVGGHPPDRGALLRAGARARREPTHVSERMRAWERAWLDVFAQWMGRHLAAHGAAPVAGADDLTVAVCVAAAIEGQLLLAEPGRPARGVPWSAAEMRLVALAASATLGGLTEEAASDAGTDAEAGTPALVAPTTGLTAAQRAILAPIQERIIEQLQSAEPTVLFNRVLDMGVLARHLGITTRSAFDRWPTASALNADLLSVALVRDRDAVTQAFRTVFSDAFGRSGSSTPAELIEALEPIIRWADIDHRTISSVDLGVLCFDPAVAAVAAREIGILLDDARLMSLALLAAAGESIRSDLTIEEFTKVSVGSLLGTLRFAKTHSDLVALTVGSETHGGRPASALAVGLAATFLQLLEP